MSSNELLVHFGTSTPNRCDGRLHVENDIGNGNAPLNSLPRPVLQSRRASEARRLFRQRAVARVHALGQRPTFKLVDEIIRHHPDLEDEIDKWIDKYADLDPDLLRRLGADRLPLIPPPRLVGGRQ
jgi:hypothetical protein